MKDIREIEVDFEQVKPSKKINWVLIWFLIGFITLCLKAGALELEWFWVMIPFWIGAMNVVWIVVMSKN